MMRFEPLYRMRYCLRHPFIRTGMIAFLILSAVVLSLLLAWWGPMKIEQLQTISALEAKRKAWHEAKYTAELNSAFLNAQATADLLEKKLHAEFNQAKAVQNISQLAAKYKVRVTSQAFETARKQEQVEIMYIDLALQGSYKGIRAILAELPEKSGWMEILEAHIENASNDGSQVKGRLTLAVYHDVHPELGRDAK